MNVSRRVIDQRVRNRIIEYFECVASLEAQHEYEAAAPAFVNVPYELINQWQDWVPKDPRLGHAEGVYSSEEWQAMRDYHEVWDQAADAVPDDYPSVAAVQQLPEWKRLTAAAASALIVFEGRGRFPEDEELP